MAPIALAFAVLDLTGSAADLGWVLAASWIPQIVFILVGGVWADRLPRNLVMIAANVLSGAAQAAVAVLLLAGVAQLWQLIVLQVARGIAISFFFPASQGITPHVVQAEELQPANALLRLSQTATSVPPSAAWSSRRSAPAGRSHSMPRRTSRARRCSRACGRAYAHSAPGRPSCESWPKAGTSFDRAPGSGSSSLQPRSGTWPGSEARPCLGRSSRRNRCTALQAGA
jgi:hypothetical protein